MNELFYISDTGYISNVTATNHIAEVLVEGVFVSANQWENK